MRKILVLDAFTNGHDAAYRFIRQRSWTRKECDIVFCGSHSNLLKRLSEGPAYAVVPVRNSIVGEVTEVTKALSAYANEGFAFEVVDTTRMQVNHCLLAQEYVMPTDLERVMSHEKAIEQCGNFLTEIGIVPERRSKRDSTGNAAKVVSRLKPGMKIAAIASRSAARAYKLAILAENIQDIEQNYTTFELLENKSFIRPVTVGIIGIGGRFGSALKRFFGNIGCTVIGSDLEIAGGLTNREVVIQSDVVIFSVPIRATPIVIRSVLPHVREGQLLMDVTSVKQPAVTEMLKTKGQVVGLHPMFAPETSFDGQTIVFCPERLTDPAWKTWVMNVLAATKCKLKRSTPAEHDMYMATVQAAPHLANLVSAILIMEMRVSTKESLTFTSPFYRLMFSQMGRLLSQDPDLYSAIIMKNPASVAMLERRIRIERRMLKMIKAIDRKSFKKVFLKAREYFGKTVAQEANELFLRLIAVTKTTYGRDSVILEYSKAHDEPGLLGKISRVFERRKINLTGINFVGLDHNHMQFAVSFGQLKSSDAVRRALESIERWTKPKIRVIS